MYLELSEAAVRACAEALTLYYSVLIEKFSSRYFLVPLGKKRSAMTPVEQKAMDDYRKHKDRFYRIDPPPRNAAFIRKAVSWFPLKTGVPDEAADELNAVITIYQETGDEGPFLRAIERLGIMALWVACEQKAYEGFVREWLYPYSKHALSLQ